MFPENEFKIKYYCENISVDNLTNVVENKRINSNIFGENNIAVFLEHHSKGKCERINIRQGKKSLF